MYNANALELLMMCTNLVISSIRIIHSSPVRIIHSKVFITPAIVTTITYLIFQSILMYVTCMQYICKCFDVLRRSWKGNISVHPIYADSVFLSGIAYLRCQFDSWHKICPWYTRVNVLFWQYRNHSAFRIGDQSGCRICLRSASDYYN